MMVHRASSRPQACAGLLLALAAAALPGAAAAQELLANRSFEDALSPAPVNGNNFYATIPGWTIANVTPAQPQPWNVILPWSGYANNPSAPPAGGGALYLDINSAAGTIRQTVTIPAAGMVDLSGWFSVRDFSQALTGLTIRLRNSANAVVASASTSFAASDPIGLWKTVSLSSVPVAAGTYVFEADIPDYGNFDLASLVFKPALAITKTSLTYTDPVNGATRPKAIPGAVVEYTIAVASPASYSVTADSLVLTDATPPGTALMLAGVPALGSGGPALFSPGTSGLSYSYAALGSTGDDIDFSSDGGVSWGYVPTIGAGGFDPAITAIRLRPRGTMAPGSNFAFNLFYVVK